LIGFPKDTTFPNFSHGTAGTAWMFALLYEVAPKPRYLELAKKGVEYLKSIAVGDETGMLVPYQDHPVTGPTFDKFYLSSCHGPVGTVLPFRKLYEITGDESYRDWCVWLSRGIIRAGAPEHYSWGYWNANCQCCGTPGILEHFVDMFEFTGEAEFLEYARRTADVLIGDSTVADDKPGQRTWYGAWTRTIPDRVVSYLGLYSGAAGCASSLLRLYANRTGKHLTPLFEYAFFRSE
ncbi:lanthionine synthetase LanC family protein, partial [Bifidobacterium sp.]|uniref:lanthionine synthetase LanC family protein n=1 Tax=Bifidobacterium sp. TaxID=41200 RepID=UPI003D7CACAE